jgi:predicted RNase H-like nuclease (RuvC/YqgF family)
LHGRLLHISSRRDENKTKLAREILDHGAPLLVAMDVRPAPHTVQKIASSLGAMMWVPARSMLVSEKNKLIKAFKKEYKEASPGGRDELKLEDKHERDALAAALRAFKSQRTSFIKIEDSLRKQGAEGLLDYVVPLLMSGRSENVTNAVRMLREKR